MFDMFKDMEKKQEELQKKLSEIVIEHKSEDGLLIVKIDANKQIKDITVDSSLIKEGDTTMLEDLLVVILNEAIQKAEAKAMEEMQNQFGDFLPNFNGFGSPFTA
jgi:DNA-binding YbaB/EbfC family protein